MVNAPERNLASFNQFGGSRFPAEPAEDALIPASRREANANASERTVEPRARWRDKQLQGVDLRRNCSAFIHSFSDYAYT
jgi:hypothetical protein